jgi:organic hydroperoxide reductase OsmC/OhrA
MIQYPLSFSVDVQTNQNITEPWMVSAGNNNSSCAIPHEFGGAGGALSPEDFFLLALSNCFVATFKVYAKASHLNFETVNVQAQLVLDKNDGNQPFAKTCQLYVDLRGVTDSSRATIILKKVARTGILLNSVKTELNFEFKLNGEKVA